MQSSFLRKAHKEGYSLGFAGLFLKADFVEAGIEPCVYMEEHYDDRTDQTVLVQINRCLGKKEFLESRLVTPRYVRVSKGLDVRVSPTALNASMIPSGPYRLVFYRVPKLHTLDIEKHLRHGIFSPHGGLARMGLRYCGPHPANIINGINIMNWAFHDPVHGKRIGCTSPHNASLPNDRTDLWFVRLRI